MSILTQSYDLPDAAIAAYQRDGYVRLKHVLPSDELERIEAALTPTVRQIQTGKPFHPDHLKLMDQPTRALLQAIAAKKQQSQANDQDGNRKSEQDTYDRAFTQIFNLWLWNDVARQVVFSPRLAQIAAKLMGVDGVRLYHDQALYKEAQGGHTPWHCDQVYWPMTSDKTVTLWMPLQAVSAEMGPLGFAARSHLMEGDEGRDLIIGDESEAIIGEKMADYPLFDAPFDLGEVSFHGGWTYHKAGPNLTDQTRAAFTVIYMDADMTVKPPTGPQQQFDLSIWFPGCKPGDRAASAINPQIL
ncbi:MAG: phytanoyl-CoA dioxygenase family protein [Alphaproteobacteria bacterium]